MWHPPHEVSPVLLAMGQQSYFALHKINSLLVRAVRFPRIRVSAVRASRSVRPSARHRLVLKEASYAVV